LAPSATEDTFSGTTLHFKREIKAAVDQTAVVCCVNLGYVMCINLIIEIAERLAKGNKAYYANSKLIKPKLLKKNPKMKIYETMIRPVVTYSSETWTLTGEDKNNLTHF
jgi:hypothetical protein